MEFIIGLNSISSYKRLSYSAWHAMAEFIDNSTQSYADNCDTLFPLREGSDQTPLTVKIHYKRKTERFPGLLTISDNAMGMSSDDLERAMTVALPPRNTSGRAQYGMGLKTAASWMGNKWKVRTKKLGESVEYTANVDVNRIAAGDSDLELQKDDGQPKCLHYTIVEITDHNQTFIGQKISDIKNNLRSMYREDFRKKTLTLYWGEEELQWLLDDDEQFLKSTGSGLIYKRPFAFTVETEEPKSRDVHGWVGVLKNGSRLRAGFSILHAERVIKGYPDSWRPTSLFGQIQGSNDLVNQRLVGEIHLDDFVVSHTKDQIVWLGDEEEKVNEELRNHCGDFREVAQQYRQKKDDQRGPTEVMVDTAISQLKDELSSRHLSYWVSSELLLTAKMVAEVKNSYVKTVVDQMPATFLAQITEDLLVRGFVEDRSPNDPYLMVDRPVHGQIDVVVNKSHPHWKQLSGDVGVLNFLRHCVYDGIAEYRAQNMKSKTIVILPDTIKLIKDWLLRMPFEIEKHRQEGSIAESEGSEDLPD